MQSFIINIPEEKVDFFLELAAMLDFEVLDIEEDQDQASRDVTDNPEEPPEMNDPFLDWEAERKNAKKNTY